MISGLAFFCSDGAAIGLSVETGLAHRSIVDEEALHRNLGCTIRPSKKGELETQVLGWNVRSQREANKMSPITGLLWKIPTVIIAALLGLMCANQAGWNGADVALNFKETGLIGDFLESLMFLVAFGICYGAILFVKWVAKPLLWVIVPIFLYAAIVLGMWNGFNSGFDTSRLAVIRDGWANSYVLAHMTPRGRYESCSDKRVRLTEDAEAVCSRALSGAPGEVVPGSQHKCGLFGMVTCYDLVPQN